MAEQFTYGERFDRWLRSSPWSASEVARLFGISTSAVSRIRSGDLVPGDELQHRIELLTDGKIEARPRPVCGECGRMMPRSAVRDG